MRAVFLIAIAILSCFASELKIATYNVENLFDAQNNGNEYKDFVVGKSKWNEFNAERKFNLIKNKIKEINADIIALQEIENEEILKRLMKESGYKYFVFSKVENAAIGLGVLSKIRPIKSHKFRISNVKTRDIIRVDFLLEDIKFSVFTLHFPARKNSLKQRILAFLALKNAICDAKNLVVLGDFNTPLNDKDGFIDDLQNQKELENLWRLVSPDERYSHISLQAIDQILLSKNLFDNAREFEVWRDERAEISDHCALSFVLNSSVVAKNQSTINQLYAKNLNFPVLVKNVTIAQKDQTGYVIDDGSKSIYVYEPKGIFGIGERFDITVNSVDKNEGKLEINSYRVAKIGTNLTENEASCD
ncbi:MAG: endonuclease/exonuclease/phosphatase family protein [Campylobacter sp.]